jgi:hypothetical protein
MKTILKVFLFFIAINSSNLYAYPHFIAHGYNSCLTCHYNPMGNGPINDYGRSVAATMVSSRGFYDDNKPEDLIAKESGFFFKENESKHFRPFVGYRGMLLKSNFGESSEKTEFINMQLDANLVIKFGEKDKYIMSGTFGYAPVPRSLKGTAKGDAMAEYKSREHYIGFRPIPEFGIYAGLLDKPFGIRVVEHSSYSRTTPLLNMNDQAHGLMLHYTNPLYEGSINLFVGNLANEKQTQTKGISGIFEYTLLEKNRIGLSLIKQKNDFSEMSAISIHSRSQLSYGTSLLFELGKVDKKPVVGNWAKKEYYSLLQNHIKTMRGLYLLNSIEYYKSNLDKNYRVRFGPGIQYFPMAKLECRLDLYNTRNFSQETSNYDRWDLLAQVHMWF